LQERIVVNAMYCAAEPAECGGTIPTHADGTGTPPPIEAAK
jgi:hypothetical protein